MPTSYPYTISNNKIEPILTRIRTAAKPDRFSRETLKTWGFTASNDRAMVGVLKELGFLTDSGSPTEHYDRLRDPNDWKYVLGERIRDLYSDLFSIDSNIQNAKDDEVKGAIGRITGKDEESVKRYFATFRTLVGLATLAPKPSRDGAHKKDEERTNKPKQEEISGLDDHHKRKAEYHYNIQIHLPVTTDVTVYNAIFKSLKEHLGV